MSFKTTLNFSNLNCYDCANKIKNELLKLPYVSNVNINILGQKMILEFTDSNKLEEKINKVKEISIELESEMKFINSSENTNIKNSTSLSKNAKMLILCIILFGISFFFPNFIFYIIIYLLAGSSIIKKAFLSFKQGRFFDENTLMAIATLGAFLIGEYREAIAVMLFSKAGEIIQDKAINKSRVSISKLMDIKPDTANVEINNSINKVHPSTVKIGDIIVVKPGEKIPLDGKVILGESTIDTKALTGEFLPKEVTVDDEVLSGCINIDSLIKIQVTSEFKDSTVLKILNLVENAASRKSNTENFITKFSQIYTPIVVLIALIVAIIPPLLIPSHDFKTWIYRSLIFLVISCPCALVISIPLSFFSGIGIASKNGVLVKGSNYLDALNKVSTVVFDKTGTLTEGNFFITKVRTNNCTESELIKLASLAENFSNHPIAKSIVNYYGKNVDTSEIDNHEEISGKGIVVNIKENKIIVGNKKLMDLFNINIDNFAEDIGTKIYVAKNNIYMGYILISDKIKKNSKNSIIELKKRNIKTVMLTGDNEKSAKKVSEDLNIDTVYSDLLPDEKVNHLENLIKSKNKKSNLVFIGDGINDAPSLAMADIGISMGGIGSDAAIEASDIVIIDDDPYKLIKAIEIANKTKSIAMQNIFISLGIKILVLSLGVLGLSSIWLALLSDVGVSLVVILNSVKMLNKKI